ncbi:MAG: hypothetical protein HY805_00205 [Nitrospirae bacterium]|nr:hypothetical protein [Nitrospirota bacterium]
MEYDEKYFKALFKAFVKEFDREIIAVITILVILGIDIVWPLSRGISRAVGYMLMYFGLVLIWRLISAHRK